jgi:branched-chain amino acid transport system substrate-binding protein
MIANRRPARRYRVAIAGLLLLALAGSTAPNVQAADKKPSASAADKEEQDAQRDFTKAMIDMIGQSLQPPDQKAEEGAPRQAGVGVIPNSLLADAVRVGMSGIVPTSAFPPSCLPILGIAKTGINPTIANASTGPVKIVVLAELTGVDAALGKNWRDGAALAARLVNSAGGILGRRVDLEVLDVGGPDGVRAAATSAINFNPVAVIGPVTAAAAGDAMDVLSRVQIPLFVGTRLLDGYDVDNRYLFRTSTTEIEEAVQIGAYMRDQRRWRRVAIVSSRNDYGERARWTIMAAMKYSNLRLVEDVRVPVGTQDFRSALLRLKDSRPDVIAVLTPQLDAARLLVEARAEGFDQPILLDGSKIGQPLLTAAGPAANGAIGLVGFFADAPVVRIRQMSEAFAQTYHYSPSPVGIQGFVAFNMVKAIVDKACSFNGLDIVNAATGLGVEARLEPGVLMDFNFGAINNVVRDNFLFEIRNQKVSVVSTLTLNSLPF